MNVDYKIVEVTMTTLRLKERRKNGHQRDIVDSGLSVARHNLMSAAEYLLSRNIDAHIVMRVLMDSLAYRLSTQQFIEQDRPG